MHQEQQHGGAAQVGVLRRVRGERRHVAGKEDGARQGRARLGRQVACKDLLEGGKAETATVRHHHSAVAAGTAKWLPATAWPPHKATLAKRPCAQRPPPTAVRASPVPLAKASGSSDCTLSSARPAMPVMTWGLWVGRGEQGCREAWEQIRWQLVVEIGTG